jgi:preprotein translocase subunit YajC
VTSDELSSLILPLLLVVVFWLLVIRPARRRQRDLAAAQSAAQPGARVMLSSGLYGEVSAAGDTDISLIIAPGVTVTVHRQAIAKVVEPSAGASHGSAGGATAAAPPDAPDRSSDP